MCNKKKILFLTSTFPRWEADTDPPFVYELCRRMKSEYLIHVLSPHILGAKTKETFHGIVVERFSYFIEKWQTLAYDGGILNRLKQQPFRYALVPFFLLGELTATIRVMCRTRIDLINAHWLIPQGLIAVIAKLILKSSVPLVCTLHGGDIFALDGLFLSKLKRLIILRTNAVIVVSHAMREKVLSVSGKSSNVHIIPMGVELYSTFVPPVVRKKKKSILFVGRFVEKKGLMYLIKALPLVLEKHPDAHLTIVGNGPLEKNIKRLVLSLDLESKAHFIGALEHKKLPSIYQDSEIVVLPFIKDTKGDMEGFGLVMVEALGCECAVIASDLPAIRDIIIDNKTGIMVEQKNIGQIADKILFLLDNPNTQRALGETGRKYVVERYDWKITEKKYTDLFKKLTN